jgi:hypothetical protein
VSYRPIIINLYNAHGETILHTQTQFNPDPVQIRYIHLKTALSAERD